MITKIQLENGCIDVPAGKIASVVTYLEMRERLAMTKDLSPMDCELKRVITPDTEWYKTLFRRIGESYLWYGRLILQEEKLKHLICHPSMEIYTVQYKGQDEGLLELDFRKTAECELTYFGLTDVLLGKGIGRRVMNRAIEIAWEHPIHRFWLHTCTDDHPAAVSFYVRSGFRPFKRQIEIADDPRLIGVLPRDVAPQIPII